jgi:hypothetical protein
MKVLLSGELQEVAFFDNFAFSKVPLFGDQ